MRTYERGSAASKESLDDAFRHHSFFAKDELQTLRRRVATTKVVVALLHVGLVVIAVTLAYVSGIAEGERRAAWDGAGVNAVQP